MADIVAPVTEGTSATAPAASGETSTTDMSVDQLLAAAIEANPDAITVTEDPPAGGAPAPVADPPVDPE